MSGCGGGREWGGGGVVTKGILLPNRCYIMGNSSELSIEES